MKKILKEIITNNGGTSSGRVINLGGFIIGSILLGYQTYQTGLTYDLFGVYMMYCSGTYGLSKFMDRKYGGKDDRYIDEGSDRYKTGYDNNDEYNVTGSRD